MLSGKFHNCYGMREFDMQEIDFASCNMAILYAPNGVMKSSFAKVFEDIAKKQESSDRIYREAITSYEITHYASKYNYSSANPTELPESNDKIYVVNSFNDKFEFTKETVSTLLADEETRNEYNTLIAEFSNEVRNIEESLKELTGLTKPKIKNQLISDLNLHSMSDWPDIFEKLDELMPSYINQDFLNNVLYDDLFNETALGVYDKREFVESIEEYITNLSHLLTNSSILSERFTDRSAETLGKAFSSNNLFEAQHKVQLRDGEIINSLSEWNAIVAQQFDIINQDPTLSTIFNQLKTLLTANNSTSRIRDIIIENREIIPYFKDIPSLKIQVWLNCLTRLVQPFEEYHTKITEYTFRIRDLYERASVQSERWQNVVSEFNRRFKVPFEVKIDNKANFLLKDEAPNLSFEYSRGNEATQQTVNLRKDDLMISLSMGEKRALYLLYILFDLDRIRQQAVTEADKFLIITDDISDSFDYKNKYAIIEYLNDLSQNIGIDLLMLTHNFDFYRTVLSRLNIARPNCYIAQKDLDGNISMTEFKYQKDFFKNVVIGGIKNGRIDDDSKKKLLLASIPFYRNLCDYTGKDNDYKKLTSFLHWKTMPINTSSAKLTDLWEIICPFLNDASYTGNDENYICTLQRIANDIVSVHTDEVSLENKLTVSIAIRISAEIFLQRKLVDNGQSCVESEYQTRKWFELARSYLTPLEISTIEEVLLITPENIHVNSFMFEPLIDISDWALKELYQKVRTL
ncbi:MAG: hypothetical protein FWG88_02585 [Oscillospiraceae bacterium]|nr:hypothetical protein [Oscillospiraceae bacterium]